MVEKPSKSYIALADEIAQEISSGRLTVGERLLPQRIYAYSRGIAVSTAGRVYEDLVRRKLVIGEVGRGTFVASRKPADAPTMVERHDRKVDLEFNFPTVPEQAELISRSLRDIDFADSVVNWQRPLSTAEIREFQAVAADFLGDDRWNCSPSAISFAGSGRKAIAAAISAVVPRGGRLAVEALSYPQIKTIANHNNVGLVPVAIDDSGLIVDALREADDYGKVSAVYVQPILQNPLGCSLSQVRRGQLIALCAERGITIIEDLIYSFLSDEAPLAALAPEQTISIDSFSKRIGAGIGVGLIRSPVHLHDRVVAAIGAGGWSATGLSMEVVGRLMSDGTAKEVAVLKREDAKRRQSVVRRVFQNYGVQSDGRAYHCWMQLPKRWKAVEFVAAAAERKIAVSAGTLFATSPGHSPNAVRFALAAPEFVRLEPALTVLVELLDAEPNAIPRRNEYNEVR